MKWQSNLLETFSMNNEIRNVTSGFRNVSISLSTFSSMSTFSSIGLKDTPKQVMSFEQKKIKKDCQFFIRLEKIQMMVKYESCVLIEDIKWTMAYLVDLVFKILAFII